MTMQVFRGGDLIVSDGQLIMNGKAAGACDEILQSYPDDVFLCRQGDKKFLMSCSHDPRRIPIRGRKYDTIQFFASPHGFIGMREEADNHVWDYVYRDLTRTFRSLEILKGHDRHNNARGAGHTLVLGIDAEGNSFLCYGERMLELGPLKKTVAYVIDGMDCSPFIKNKEATFLTFRAFSDLETIFWILDRKDHLEGPFFQEPLAFTTCGKEISIHTSEDGYKLEKIRIGTDVWEFKSLQQNPQSTASVKRIKSFQTFTLLRIDDGITPYDLILIWTPSGGFKSFYRCPDSRQFSTEVGNKPCFTVPTETGQNRIQWGDEMIGPPIEEVRHLGMGRTFPIVFALVMDHSNKLLFQLFEGDEIFDPDMKDAFLPSHNDRGHRISLDMQILIVGSKAVYAKKESGGTEGIYIHGKKMREVTKVIALKAGPSNSSVKAVVVDETGLHQEIIHLGPIENHL